MFGFRYGLGGEHEAVGVVVLVCAMQSVPFEI